MIVNENEKMKKGLDIIDEITQENQD